MTILNKPTAANNADITPGLAEIIDNPYIIYDHKVSVSWEWSHQYAVSQGGRLPTTQELQQFVATKSGQKTYSSENWDNPEVRSKANLIDYPGEHSSWVASGTPLYKDWVQIGVDHNGNHPGKSLGNNQ